MKKLKVILIVYPKILSKLFEIFVMIFQHQFFYVLNHFNLQLVSISRDHLIHSVFPILILILFIWRISQIFVDFICIFFQENCAHRNLNREWVCFYIVRKGDYPTSCVSVCLNSASILSYNSMKVVLVSSSKRFRQTLIALSFLPKIEYALMI